MNTNTPPSPRFAASVAATLVLAAIPAAEAATVNFTAVRSGFSNFESMAVDPDTGKVYERAGYNGETAVRVYSNIAAFAANAPTTTLNLSPAGYFGTYISISQGQLYGRTDNSTSAAGTWSITTGSQTATVSGFAAMGGFNGSDTYDWGGFSGVNFMQDSTGRYVVGGDASSNDWQIVHLGVGLSSVSTTVYTPVGDTSPGWGFIISGTLFTGSNYNSNIVTNAVDVDTGSVSLANHTLSGLGSNLYLSDFSYDYASDTLYAFNVNDGTLYQAINASEQFGLVPEPSSLALLCLGALGIGFGRRRTS
jgi:autoaggregation protein RapA/B/C